MNLNTACLLAAALTTALPGASATLTPGEGTRWRLDIAQDGAVTPIRGQVGAAALLRAKTGLSVTTVKRLTRAATTEPAIRERAEVLEVWALLCVLTGFSDRLGPIGVLVAALPR